MAALALACAYGLASFWLPFGWDHGMMAAAGERQRRVQLLYGFMAVWDATAFIMSTELVEPDCVLSAAIDRDGVLIAARPILRKPLTLGPVEWLPASAVGDEVVALLPRGKVTLHRETEAALVRAFGSDGEFEAQKN